MDARSPAWRKTGSMQRWEGLKKGKGPAQQGYSKAFFSGGRWPMADRRRVPVASCFTDKGPFAHFPLWLALRGTHGNMSLAGKKANRGDPAASTGIVTPAGTGAFGKDAAMRVPALNLHTADASLGLGVGELVS